MEGLVSIDVLDQIIEAKQSQIDLLTWCLTGACGSLVAAIGILWFAYEKKVKYVIEQDKANLLFFTELTNSSKNLGVDVTKVLDHVTHIKPNVTAVREKLHEIIQGIR